MIVQYATRIMLVREESPGYDATTPVRCPTDVARVVADLYHGLDREAVVALALDVKHRIAARYVVSVGVLDGAPAHPREVYKAAIVANAAGVILVHNHPSGDLTPSPLDIGLTKRMIDAGELLGIPLLDHVIVDGSGRYLSLREGGYVDCPNREGGR